MRKFLNLKYRFALLLFLVALAAPAGAAQAAWPPVGGDGGVQPQVNWNSGVGY